MRENGQFVEEGHTNDTLLLPYSTEASGYSRRRHLSGGWVRQESRLGFVLISQ
jgi:hypothetical protein